MILSNQNLIPFGVTTRIICLVEKLGGRDIAKRTTLVMFTSKASLPLPPPRHAKQRESL